MLYKYNMSSEASDDEIFKALANGTRRRLLDAMKDAPQTTGALCDAFPDIDRCTVMQHLKVLEQAGLVLATREGRERWNHLNAMPIQKIHDRWISRYAGQAMSVLGALQAGLAE